MKIIVIGDIHGRDIWENIVEKNKGNTFIFLGDYLDPYKNITDLTALINLKRIVKFKKNNENVHLLIGNHDMPYIFYPKIRPNSIIRNTRSNESVSFFRRNKKYFEFSHQIGNKLFLHAGVSNGWLKDNLEIFESFGLKDDNSNISDIINLIGNSKHKNILNDISIIRGGGKEHGGPLWADKRELYYKSDQVHLNKDPYISRDIRKEGYTFKDILYKIHQYVGHSKVDKIYTLGDENQSITFCDVLDRSDDYLTLDI